MNLSNLKFSHFSSIQRRGYTLDMIFLLNLIVEEQPDVAKEVTQHLLDNREENIKDDIKRKIKK